eukprot:3269185-Rhodomonas_salina.2
MPAPPPSAPTHAGLRQLHAPYLHVSISHSTAPTVSKTFLPQKTQQHAFQKKEKKARSVRVSARENQLTCPSETTPSLTSPRSDLARISTWPDTTTNTCNAASGPHTTYIHRARMG